LDFPPVRKFRASFNIAVYMFHSQRRSDRVCMACSARGSIARGGSRRTLCGEEGVLLESLHTGPAQPCYATGFTTVSCCCVLVDWEWSVMSDLTLVACRNAICGLNMMD